MAQIKVPKSVKEHLSVDEEVIGKLSINTDYYATNKRLLVFKRSEIWVALFGLLGLLAQKKYRGDIEYSRISGITLKKHRSKLLLIAGLIIALPLLIFGFVFMNLGEAGTVVGWVFIMLALFTIVIMSVMKQAYYQVESQDFTEKEMKKYRLNKPRIGGKKIDRFVEVVRERISR